MTNRYFVYKVFLALSLFVVGCAIIRSEGFTYQESVPVEVDYLRLDGYYYRVETSSPPDKGKYISIVIVEGWDGSLLKSRVFENIERKL